MLSRESEDKMWSRFVIWPQEVTLARWTQFSGPLCLWQCLCILFKKVVKKPSPVTIIKYSSGAPTISLSIAYPLSWHIYYPSIFIHYPYSGGTPAPTLSITHPLPWNIRYPLSMFIHYQCSSTIHVHPLFIHVRPLSIFRWYPRPHTQRHTSTTLELSMPLLHLWAQMSLLCGGEIQFKMLAYNFKALNCGKRERMCSLLFYLSI